MLPVSDKGHGENWDQIWKGTEVPDPRSQAATLLSHLGTNQGVLTVVSSVLIICENDTEPREKKLNLHLLVCYKVCNSGTAKQNRCIEQSVW